MVGTFISKYLLVTTSTITVTSSAAVTFFVAKHLKIGKGYEKMLNYMKERYCAVVNYKSERNQNIASISANIYEILNRIIKDKSELLNSNSSEKISTIHDTIRSELSKLLDENGKHLSAIQNDEEKLQLNMDYLRLEEILGEYVDSLKCSKTYF